jgi:2-methylisocitrate lyase-like PEP mutase family enzyme
MPTTAEKRRTFLRLHEAGCFVIPNPWGVGTTRYLQHLGFKALATTSAGAAFAMGLPDGMVSRDAMLAHINAIVAASDVPVNADFQSGYAKTPREVGENDATPGAELNRFFNDDRKRRASPPSSRGLGPL